MKVFSADQFLTKGSATFASGFRGVAIHPSSEVDVVEVAGTLVTVGGVVPIDPGSAIAVKAVRGPLPRYAYLDLPQHRALDGGHVIGEKLMLAMYEHSDPLVPVGTRVPLAKRYAFADELLPATKGTAQLISRVPMHGRATCALHIFREETTLDMTLLVYGRRNGTRDTVYNSNGIIIGVAEETWFSGGVPPDFLDGLDASARGFYVQNERYDELLLYAYGTAGGAASTEVGWEVYGEGVNQ